jgi:hypothetical protein
MENFLTPKYGNVLKRETKLDKEKYKYEINNITIGV